MSEVMKTNYDTPVPHVARSSSTGNKFLDTEHRSISDIRK